LCIYYTPSLSQRLTIQFCIWLLARVGIRYNPYEEPVGQGAGPVAHSLRDKRGRFRPKDGGGYGLPRNIPHHVADLMHDMGITPPMYESAPVALVLPDDVEDIAALEASLREWIVHNINHWINGQKRSIHSVFESLKSTYAISFYRFKPPQRMLGYQGTEEETPERRQAEARASSARAARLEKTDHCDETVGRQRRLPPLCPDSAQCPNSPQRAESALGPYEANAARSKQTAASVMDERQPPLAAARRMFSPSESLPARAGGFDVPPQDVTCDGPAGLSPATRPDQATRRDGGRDAAATEPKLGATKKSPPPRRGAHT